MIFLASASPRRQQLLRDMGFDFQVEVYEIDESLTGTEDPTHIALDLAVAKSKAFRPLEKGELVITADTVVVIEGEVLNKPVDRADAMQMLQRISGNTHVVYTGVCVRTAERQHTLIDEAKVTIREMDDDEIRYYLDTFKPYDKAGAYGIQDWLGLNFISRIEGSFYTVMGLPTHRLYPLLRAYQQ